ncbi:GcrA family cell cycle regulator [Chthonobacter rhizosphaerae]|uniref:GcrA family cell cycle regulator n=1 Tax=Chthonobacter rhizosphaerae TaxID=2735553 RepID=UPI0015EF7FC9|nr:GcrA family cell cycle regulator [Chthonobacter rhizosphaerae]
MSWTDERVERLKSLWSEGLSASQIAAELGGVTRNAVIGKVHRLGLSGRVKPQVQPARPAQAAPARPKPVQGRPAAQQASSPVRPAQPITIGNVVVKADPDLERETAVAVEPRILPVIDAEPVSFERVTILNLTEQTCKWPIGDPGRPDFFFCGRKSDSGIPYCAFHARVAYQPSNDRKREKRAAAG